MAFGSTFKNDLALLIYQGTTISNVAINATSSPDTNYYVSLHTATPVAGDQTTNEISYTGMARQGVARSSGGWSITAGVITPVAEIVFPTSSSGTPTATHFSTGRLSSGAGKLIDVG